MTLQNQLKSAIETVFTHHVSFTIELLSEYSHEVKEIEEFYMASERCRVVFTTRSQGEIHTTIKTADFMEWLEMVHK